jgi:hypothetical protein
VSDSHHLLTIVVAGNSSVMTGDGPTLHTASAELQAQVLPQAEQGQGWVGPLSSWAGVDTRLYCRPIREGQVPGPQALAMVTSHPAGPPRPHAQGLFMHSRTTHILPGHGGAKAGGLAPASTVHSQRGPNSRVLPGGPGGGRRNPCKLAPSCSHKATCTMHTSFEIPSLPQGCL